GNVDRFRAGAWTRLLEPGSGLYFGQRLAWIGDDELIYFAPDGRHLRHYQNGQDSEETSEVPIDQLISLTMIRGYGIFAGMVSGWVLIRGTTWRQFRGPFIGAVSADSFATFDGGLLLGGGDGDI